MRYFQVMAAASAALCLSAAPIAAQDFYAGKTITIYSGHQAGSGYDTNARLIARHLGRYLPGNPHVIVRNMPGAATLIAANHVVNTAPQDGTALALPARGAALESLLGGKGVRFDPLKLHWIGSTSQEVSLVSVRTATGVKTLADAKTRDLTLAGSTADSVTFPNILNALAGTRFKAITSYRSGAEMILAIERGEVDGRAAWSWSAFRNDGMPMVERGVLSMLVQMGLAKVETPELAKVPLVMDYAKTEDHRQILTVLLAAQGMAWPIFAPPGVPAERVAQLRGAYLAVLKDDEARADARKMGVDIEAPVPGVDIQKLLARVYATPPEIVAKARTLSGRK